MTDEAPKTFTAEEMKAVNDEAKGYRLKLREAEQERDAFKSQLESLTGERDQLMSERDKLSADLEEINAKGELRQLVEKVAGDYKVPVEVLRGNTEEELVAHAEALKPVYERANGPYVPNIGDTPDEPTNEAAQFVGELFGNN